MLTDNRQANYPWAIVVRRPPIRPAIELASLGARAAAAKGAEPRGRSTHQPGVGPMRRVSGWLRSRALGLRWRPCSLPALPTRTLPIGTPDLGLDWSGAQAKLQCWRKTRFWAVLAGEALRPIQFRLGPAVSVAVQQCLLRHGPGIDIDPIDINSLWARWAVKALPAYREEVPVEMETKRLEPSSRSPIELRVTKC